MDCPAYVPSRQCSYPKCMFRIVLMLLAREDWVPPDTDVYPGVENLNALFAHQRRIPNDYCNNDFDTEYKDMGVSKNNGTPKSSILIGFSTINHPFCGTPIFGNTHM